MLPARATSSDGAQDFLHSNLIQHLLEGFFRFSQDNAQHTLYVHPDEAMRVWSLAVKRNEAASFDSPVNLKERYLARSAREPSASSRTRLRRDDAGAL